VQANADGTWSARTLSLQTQCPSLVVDGQAMAMHTRAEPATVPARAQGAQALAKASIFNSRSCELTLPTQARQATLNGQALPLPSSRYQRIVLMGDTGCRMKQSEAAYQDCNDEQRWPFAKVALQAAALKPDLVLHVGDLHYRESPCPEGRAGCANSPWGYGDDAWQADVFAPAAPLLAAAPWVLVRGNHESCNRAGVGWFRYFDARPWQAGQSCQDPELDSQAEFTEPFAVALDATTQLIVFDSAFAAGKAYRGQEPAFLRYQAQLQTVAGLARQKPHNIFVNHHPVLGFGGSRSGQPLPGHAGLRSVMSVVNPGRLYAPEVDLVLNGHVHLFEALGFASEHPAVAVVGNAGSAMEGHIDPAQAQRAQPAPGAVVGEFVTQSDFGFALLERADDGWTLSEWSVNGQRRLSCQLRHARLRC
jgi:hypothetical protein